MDESRRIFLSPAGPSPQVTSVLFTSAVFPESHDSYQTWYSNKGTKNAHFLSLLLFHCLEFHNVVTSSLKILKCLLFIHFFVVILPGKFPAREKSKPWLLARSASQATQEAGLQHGLLCGLA